jgi:hypothetical protein
MNLKLIGVYALIHLAANLWFEHSKMGQGVKHYLQNWRADGWVHGIMCSVSVFIVSCCAILALGLTLHALGI